VSNTINSSLVYLRFLQSERNSIIVDLKKYKTGRTNIKKSKPILVRIDELDNLHNELLLKLQKLLFFMEIWNSPSLEELFTDQDIHYAITNFDDHQDFYINSLLKLSQFAKDFHHKIIQTAKEHKKVVPFSLKENITNDDENTISLYAKIIHST